MVGRALACCCNNNARAVIWQFVVFLTNGTITIDLLLMIKGALATIKESNFALCSRKKGQLHYKHLFKGGGGVTSKLRNDGLHNNLSLSLSLSLENTKPESKK